MSESWQQNAPRPLAPGMRRMSFEAFWEAVPENVHTLAAAGAAGGDPCDELSGEEDGTGKKEASEVCLCLGEGSQRCAEAESPG